MSALAQSDYDPDFPSPTEPREGVSPEQQALIVALDLSEIEKAKALNLLSDLAQGVRIDVDEDMANLYGLTQGSDGLWRDAMVLIDPARPELGYQFDPSVVP